jgi:hypothetical protein
MRIPTEMRIERFLAPPFVKNQRNIVKAINPAISPAEKIQNPEGGDNRKIPLPKILTSSSKQA